MTLTRAVDICTAMLRENEDEKCKRFDRLSNEEMNAIAHLCRYAVPEAWGERAKHK
ncbi:MAG: hypothetical protein WBG02_01490 [Candidatus Acidiferrum sp.]